MDKMNDLRLVRVGNELGYFHCWEQYSRMFGIVEFDNRIESVDLSKIQFVDETNAMLNTMVKHDEEVEKTLKKIEQLGDILREKSK